MFEKYITVAKKFYKTYKKIISGVIYMLMVFVVVYGISQGVYAGFPIAVPYLVMLVFMIMAFSRLYQWIITVPPDKKSDSSEESEKK